MFEINVFCLPSIRTKFSRFDKVRKNIHDKEVAALLHRCAYARQPAFVKIGVACTKQVS